MKRIVSFSLLFLFSLNVFSLEQKSVNSQKIDFFNYSNSNNPFSLNLFNSKSGFEDDDYSYYDDSDDSGILSKFGGDSKEYARFEKKGFVVKLNADWGYNYWVPHMNNLVDYKTVGLPLAQYEAVIYTHFLPEIRFAYETTFGKHPQRALLRQYEQGDGLKPFYNKLKVVVGIADIFRLATKHYDYFNPWRSNSDIKLTYNREAFRIGVSPKINNMRYISSENTTKALPVDKTFFQYSKFDEIDLDFATNGKLALPFVYSLLFDKEAEAEIIETNNETSLGLFVSWFNKPYSVKDYNNNDSYYVIYDANFYSAGLVEKICYAGDIFYFNNTSNMGLAFVLLSQDKILTDSQSIMFMQFNIAPEVGIHLPMLNHRVVLSAYGSCNWGFLYGVNFNDDKDEGLLKLTNFINGDVILKGSVSFTVLL